MDGNRLWKFKSVFGKSLTGHFLRAKYSTMQPF